MHGLSALAGALGTRFDDPRTAALLAPYRLVHALEPPLEAGMAPEEHLSSSEHGLLLRLADGTVTTMFLFCEGREGFRQFGGALGDGLSFSSASTEVTAVLGPPRQVAPAGRTLLGAHGGWCAYERSGYRLHFEFRADGRGIGLLTLSAPSGHGGV